MPVPLMMPAALVCGEGGLLVVLTTRFPLGSDERGYQEGDRDDEQGL